MTPLSSKLHVILTTIQILIGMGTIDSFLVNLNVGQRQTGVFVMLLIGNVCMLIILRYVGTWVGAEVSTTKRGCSMAEWFLFIFVLDIKVYFIFQYLRTECPMLKEKSCSPGSDLDGSLVQLSDCVVSSPEVAGINRQTLTLVQSLILPILYCTLVGADHLRYGAEELRLKSIIVVMDLLDVLELQSCVWEGTTLCLGFTAECILYFYCYILLLLLPTVSLAEISRSSSGEIIKGERWKMLIYMAMSLVFVNISLSSIRIFLIIKFKSLKPSRIFLGKNLIFFCVQTLKLCKTVKEYYDNYEERVHPGYTDIRESN